MTIEHPPENLTPRYAERTKVFEPLVIVSPNCRGKCRHLESLIGEASVKAFRRPDEQIAVVCPGKKHWFSLCDVYVGTVSFVAPGDEENGRMLRNPAYLIHGTMTSTTEEMIREAVENGADVSTLTASPTDFQVYPGTRQQLAPSASDEA